MVGRTVLQYQLGERLGAGGMGEVYKALDTRLNRFVAIKVLSADMSADPECRLRFIQEAQAASALNHPNIVTIYDVVYDGDTQYMVAEYVAGKTLLELIPKDGLQAPEAIRYAVQMSDALSVAHVAGIIHRDLKPANVMVNGSGLVKLLDFGLAKRIDLDEHTGNTATLMHNPLTVAGAIMGTASYMSPEQAEGWKLDARSDIFSFGAVLYEMLTGRCAFRGDSAISTLSAVLRDDIEPIGDLTAGVPFALEQIVVRCLKKNPDERFQSMREVNTALVDLKRMSDSGALYSPPTIRTIVPTPPPRAPRGSKALVLSAVFVIVVAAIGGGYWWTIGHGAVSPQAPNLTKAQAVSAAQPSDGTLTNDNIIDMVGAKVAPSVIVSTIRASKTNFNLSADEVIRLTKAGVPADLIEVMRNPDAAHPEPPAAAPVVVSDGTLVRLTLADDIPSDARQGDAVRFKVAHDLRVDGSVVVPEGAAAAGVIVDGAKRKILLIGGKMTLSLQRVDAADGRKLNLRATPASSRDGISKRPVNTSGPKPKGVASPAGAEYVGYIDGPQTVLPGK
jgi:serine/threonine protein kinase